MDRKGYGLDVPENESRLGQDFSHWFRPILDPNQPHIHGYRIFALGKAEGVAFTTYSHLVPKLKKV